jgi:hypothetical protein
LDFFRRTETLFHRPNAVEEKKRKPAEQITKIHPKGSAGKNQSGRAESNNPAAKQIAPRSQKGSAAEFSILKKISRFNIQFLPSTGF